MPNACAMIRRCAGSWAAKRLRAVRLRQARWAAWRRSGSRQTRTYLLLPTCPANGSTAFMTADRLVADELEGKADKNRREGGEPRPLYRLPDGRSRHPPANVPGDTAAHCRTTAAAATSASVRWTMIIYSRATDRRSAPERQGKTARSAPGTPCGLPEVLVAVSTARQSCVKNGKARLFTPVREPSGESRLSCRSDRIGPELNGILMSWQHGLIAPWQN